MYAPLDYGQFLWCAKIFYTKIFQVLIFWGVPLGVPLFWGISPRQLPEVSWGVRGELRADRRPREQRLYRGSFRGRPPGRASERGTPRGGWQNTVEAVPFDISSSMIPLPLRSACKFGSLKSCLTLRIGCRPICSTVLYKPYLNSVRNPKGDDGNSFATRVLNLMLQVDLLQVGLPQTRSFLFSLSLASSLPFSLVSAPHPPLPPVSSPSLLLAPSLCYFVFLYVYLVCAKCIHLSSLRLFATTLLGA